MKSGRFLPNLSEKVLTVILPIKNAAKITEVETNPKEPRSHTRSNYEIKLGEDYQYYQSVELDCLRLLWRS